jgi:DNA-binding NtrC family response regulator
MERDNSLKEAVKHYKYLRYLRALAAERGMATRAAERLGVHRNTINRMMRDLGMSSHELRCGLGAKQERVSMSPRRSRQVAA